MSHPPWLRFQAFVVGLPKTGSTSLATIFGNYRTGHEAGTAELIGSGLRWLSGEIDEAGFWRETSPRLTSPTLEMDSATCHHLYAELLVARFPHAVFIHSVRDVGGWMSSLLDMSVRYRVARSVLPMKHKPEHVQFMDRVTGGELSNLRTAQASEAATIVPMMRYWAAHLSELPLILPPERALLVRTRDIANRLDDLARLCGVPPATLRADLSHSNRAPFTLRRLALYDSAEVRAAYEHYCAGIMASMFPEEHAQIWDQSLSLDDWHEHVEATTAWVYRAIEEERGPQRSQRANPGSR